MAENPYPDAWRHFSEQTKDHELEVLHEDGLYRRLRMSTKGSWVWHWEIVTWPGHLCMIGDIGQGWAFSRDTDMFEFFRRRGDHRYSDGSPWIDFRYWSEKTSMPWTTREFSPEIFRAKVREALDETRLHPSEVKDLLNFAGEVESEEYARNMLASYEEFLGGNTWEWNLKDFSTQFLLTCYAIEDTVRAWDERKLE